MSTTSETWVKETKRIGHTSSRIRGPAELNYHQQLFSTYVVDRGVLSDVQFQRLYQWLSQYAGVGDMRDLYWSASTQDWKLLSSSWSLPTVEERDVVQGIGAFEYTARWWQAERWLGHANQGRGMKIQYTASTETNSVDAPDSTHKTTIHFRRFTCLTPEQRTYMNQYFKIGS
jgi:hypothetical protein